MRYVLTVCSVKMIMIIMILMMCTDDEHDCSNLNTKLNTEFDV